MSKKDEDQFFDLGDDIPVAEETLTAKESTTVASASTSLEVIYDRYMKLIYCIDVSISMKDGMISEEIEKAYIWTDNLLEMFLEKMKAESDKAFSELDKDAAAKLIASAQDDSSDEEEEDRDDPKELEFNAYWGCYPDEVLELKRVIVEKNLSDYFNITIIKREGEPEPKSKMDIVKENAAQAIVQRFDKYPDADVTILEFNHEVQPTGSVTKEGLLKFIEHMKPHGSTDILKALEETIKLCKKNPSKIGSHHVVLVTDAEDTLKVEDIETILKRMKDKSVVLDFIFIKLPRPYYGGWTHAPVNEAVELLRQLCNKTGGEFVEVVRPGDFREKFLKASTRLCLPLERKA